MPGQRVDVDRLDALQAVVVQGFGARNVALAAVLEQIDVPVIDPNQFFIDRRIEIGRTLFKWDMLFVGQPGAGRREQVVVDRARADILEHLLADVDGPVPGVSLGGGAAGGGEPVP